MHSRHRRFGRTASFLGVIVLAPILLAPGYAQDTIFGAWETKADACPTEVPRLEGCGGQSLFWHDPCGGGYHDNRLACFCHDSVPPRIYGTVEFLPLFRDESGSTVYQAVAFREVETQNGDVIITYRRESALDSGDLDTGFEPGVRALIGLALGDWYRVEYCYFGSYSWSDSASVRYDADDGTGNLLSPFSSFGDREGRPGLDPLPEADFEAISGLDFNDDASIRLSSRLNNFELNLRRRLCLTPNRHLRAESSCLVGLRYINLHEALDYRTESPLPDPGGSQNAETVRTDNDLFGPQIGAQAQFLVHDRAWIDVDIKGAILFDRAEGSVAAVVNPGGALSSAAFSNEEDATAFLGDLSVQFNYQFAPAWTLRLGYNAIWLTGVALATENFVSDIDTLVNNGPGSVDHSGNVVYHGPSIGFTFAH